MLNPDKKNYVFITAFLFQFALSHAAFQLFSGSYYCIIKAEIISGSGNNSNDDGKTFLVQYPLFLMLTSQANIFPLFGFLGTFFDNIFGFRMYININILVLF